MSDALSATSSTVFLPTPSELKIDEKRFCKRYVADQKINTLIEVLKTEGAVIALAEIGPSFYKEKPKCFTIEGKEVYGWPPKAERMKHSSSYVMILGAKISGEIEHVYFTPAVDITEGKKPLRTYKPSILDRKIYVTSHKTFKSHLVDLCLPESLESAPSPKESFIQRLKELPLDSILDGKDKEAECKAIGQEIFDHYKKEANGNSLEGKARAQEICEALADKEEPMRKKYVEYAWDGIGDKNWQWFH